MGRLFSLLSIYLSIYNFIYYCLFRLFLQELPECVSKYPAGIRSTLETHGQLQHFIALKNKYTNWDVEKTTKKVGDSHLPEPAAKKRRRKL